MSADLVAPDVPEEDPQEVLAACRELAEEVREMAAELTRTQAKTASVATGIMPLVDMTDRSTLGFAAGLDLLIHEVVPALLRLAGCLVADAECLVDPATPPATDRTVMAARPRPAAAAAVARLRTQSRSARRRARWAVFDRSYHQGYAGALEVFAANMTVVAEGLIEAGGIIDQRLAAARPGLPAGSNPPAEGAQP